MVRCHKAVMVSQSYTSVSHKQRLSQAADDTWNQLVMSYDGQEASFYINKDYVKTVPFVGTLYFDT